MSETDSFTSSWLNSYGQSTSKGYRIAINVFFQFLDQTWSESAPWNGDKVHQDRKASQRSDDETVKFKYEDVIVKFAIWLRSKKSAYPFRHDASSELISDGTVRGYCIAVRSFFAYMRMPLILNRPQKHAIAKTGTIRNMPYHLTLADIVAMKRQANTKERYVLLVAKSLGLRIGDFVSLRQGLFEGNLKDRDAPYSLGVIVTEKRKQPAYAFLDYEAYEAYLNWRQELQALNKWDGKDKYMLCGTRPDSHMTVQEVNSMLKRLASRAGLRLGNLHLSFHCFRKFLCDHLSTAVGDANKWKQIVGKQIPESAYISSDNLREAYAKVMQYTCEERTVRLGDVADLKQIVVEQQRTLNAQSRDIAYLETHVKELKGVIQEFSEGMPKYLPELLRELNAKGLISADLLKQAEKDTLESLAKTKGVMDEEFMKVYSKATSRYI